MKVSIIMCSYNVASYIDEAIQSVLNQTYTHWELIISDDASKDDTVAIIEKYLTDKRIKLFRHEKNMGYVKNKNYAFTKATGDLLTQLDADDACPKERLEKQVNAFLQYPELKINGTNFCQMYSDSRLLSAKKYPKDDWINNFDADYPFWFPGVMFRKELLEEFGYFSEYFDGIYGDDNYWVVRVNKKYPIYFIKEVLYYYRINPNSITNVNDNPRKMIVKEILEKLKAQQQKTGTDWLVEGTPEKLREYEASLLKSDKILAEKYRIYAAKEIDRGNAEEAKKWLRKSFHHEKFNLSFYRTLWYHLRTDYKNK